MVQLHQQHAVSWGCAGAERKHAEATAAAAAAYTDAWGAASDAGTDTTANTECMSSTVCTVAAGGRSSVGSSDDDSRSPCASAAVVAAAVLEPHAKELPRGLRRLSHCASSVSASPEQRRLRTQTLGSVAPPSPTASHGASSSSSLCEYLRIEGEVAAAAAAAAAASAGASAGASGSAPCTPRDQIQGGAAASSGLTPLLREGFFSDEVELKTVRKRGRSVADGGDCDEGAAHTDEECSPPCAKRRQNSLSHSPAPPSSVGSAHLNIFGELRAASARAAASLSPAPATLAAATACAVPSLRPLFGDVVAAARHATAEAAAAEAAAEEEDGSDWTGRSSSTGGVSEAGMTSENGGVPAEVCERLDAAFSELLFLAKGGECEAAVESAKKAVVQAVFDTLDAYPGVDLSSWMRLTSMVYQRCITEELQRRAAGIRAASVAPASPSPSHPASVAGAGEAATVPVQRLNHRRSFYLAVVDTDDAESEEAEGSESPAETAAATSRAAAAGGDDGSKVLRQRGDWLEVACEQGVYYFNEETEESKWDAEGTGFDAASVNSAGEPAGDDASPYRRRRTLLQMAQLLEDANAEDAATEAGTAEGDEDAEEVLRRIGDWLEVRCDQGLYYFNEETEESTWTKEGTAFEGEPEEDEDDEAVEGEEEGWSPATHSPEGRAVKRMRSASPVRGDGCYCDSGDDDYDDDAWRHSPVKTPAKRARMADAPSATSVLAAAAAFEQAAAAGAASPAAARRTGAVASDLAMLQGLQRVSGEAAAWEAAAEAAATASAAQHEVPPAIADAICGVMFRERVAAAVADADATSTEASPAEVSALGRAAFGLGPCAVPLLTAVDDDAAAATATDSGELTRRRRKKKRDAEKERMRKKEQKRRRRAAAAAVALTPEPAAAAEAAAEAAVATVDAGTTAAASTAPPALPSFLAVPPTLTCGGRVATMSTSSTSTTTTTSSSCSDYGDDTDLNATATSLACDADADGADTHRRRRARRKDPAKERLRKKAQKKDKKKRRAAAEGEEGVSAGHGATEAAGITLELAGRLG